MLFETGNFEVFGVEETLVIDPDRQSDNARRVARVLELKSGIFCGKYHPVFIWMPLWSSAADYERLKSEIIIYVITIKIN